MRPPVLAITLGDPAGIGPEIAVRTLAEFSAETSHHGVAVGDIEAVRRAADACRLNVALRQVDDFRTAPLGEGVIDVFDTGVLGAELPAWGTVDARAGRAAIAAIEVAVTAALEDQVDGVVTGPINKEAIWAAGSEHLGHTEMLGALTGVENQDTMFVVRSRHSDHHLRIFFATRHTSLRQAVDKITQDRQLESIRRAMTALQVFGVKDPHLAVAALNPHGGENGAFGDEEIMQIFPACEQARKEGLRVAGPIPADTVFHHGLVGRYDGVLSQYHDQGHIASKTYDFDGTVSVTVGLPILRTSVDHGTAFDIAGTGKADPATLRSAYLTAVEYSSFVASIRSEYSPQPATVQSKVASDHNEARPST
jgi:4-hydroxythreonine-4-phosphate dehydrogenase